MNRLLRLRPLGRFAFTSSLALVAVIVISILASHAASAQAANGSVLGACPGNTFINEIPNQFCNATLGWLTNALNAAKRFFFILVSIELAWSAIMYLFQKENIGELLASFIPKMMGIWFFYAILLNADRWLPAIMSSFMQLSTQITGFNPTDPNTIFMIGIGLCNRIFSSLPQAGFYFSLVNIPQSVTDDLFIVFCMLAAVIFAAIICFIIFISFAIVAGQLIMTLIEAYIMIGAGAVMLGFTGSRWTLSFGEKYIGYAIAIGIKLFVIFLILGLSTSMAPGQSLAMQWNVLIGDVAKITFGGQADLPKLGQMVIDYLELGISAIIFMMLATKLPGLAASMMNGSPSMTLGGAMSTLSSATGAIAGAAGAVAGTANEMFSGVKEAAMMAATAGAGAAAGGAGSAGGAADAGASGGMGGAGGSGGSDGGGASEALGLAMQAGGIAGGMAAAPAMGSMKAAGAALQPLFELDEGGGGSVSIGLRMPE